MTTSGTLMNQTLPALVGMGVVSKTTDTMFGKGKRRRATSAKSRMVGSRKVHTGKRGGKFVMKKGRRVYI